MITFNKIYNEDCLTTLKKIPDNTINLIITSPPYNKNHYTKKAKITKKDTSTFRTITYDSYNDDLRPSDYIEWQKKVIKECLRVLKPDGSLFYNHMDILHNHNTIHPSYIYDFPIKQVLIWDRRNTPKLDKNYFYPINEFIFWLKKTKESKPKYNRNKCVFKKSVIRLGAAKENEHPAPFPLELANNFVLACTKKNDIVYDPFMGSGTTAIACVINNRRYLGSEISEDYTNSSRKILDKHIAQQRLF